jgi:hypothetical protein
VVPGQVGRDAEQPGAQRAAILGDPPRPRHASRNVAAMTSSAADQSPVSRNAWL